MIAFKDIQERFSKETKEIEVKSWGGTVKIRKLTIRENDEVQAMFMNDATTEELSNGNLEISISKLQASQRLAVSMALVEPKLSVKQLEDLPTDAAEGIAEIYEQLQEWDKPKK